MSYAQINEMLNRSLRRCLDRTPRSDQIDLAKLLTLGGAGVRHPHEMNKGATSIYGGCIRGPVQSVSHHCFAPEGKLSLGSTTRKGTNRVPPPEQFP
jgi:hypothetical protein